MSTAILVIVSLVLLFDLWLVYMRQPTISQRYQAMFPTYVDLVVMCLLIPLIVHVEVRDVVKVVLAVLAGHLFFPNKELWK